MNALGTKRVPVQATGVALAGLTFQTLGIIYSDVGTSPLYTINGIWPASGPAPSKEDIIGGVSAIIWALTLLPLIKYAFISLYFGTKEGEGGSFALYQGIYPRAEKDHDADRTLTGDSISTGAPMNSQSLKSKIQFPLLLWCLFGTALTMADGALTPAVSITSAVGGIGVAKPEVTKDIIPISIVFILVLFLIQRIGTARIGFTFAPISSIWFMLLAGTGIYNVTTHPAIFRAFDPSRAILLFVRTKNYDFLAGVILAVTGSEAMFANLGQFNATSIRLSFCSMTYPALILAYLGQGARLIEDGDKVITNVFYRSIPGPVNGPLYWIVFIFGILATLVASQAMITATFSLVQQVVNLKSFPPIRMHHTSDTVQGQIYIPAVNWVLMLVTIGMVGGFKDLAQLSNAYGFSVATVMLSTTGLLAIQMRYVKRWNIVVPILFFLFFGFIDACFWGASLKKVPHGAWVPLMLGVILELLMVLWTWAKKLEDQFDGENRMNLRHLIGMYELDHKPTTAAPSAAALPNLESYTSATPTKGTYLVQRSGETTPADVRSIALRKELVRIQTCAIFYKISEGKGVPHTFVGFIRQWPALPRIVIFLSVVVVPVAHVPKGEQYVVTKVRSVEGFYGVTHCIGFRDDVDVKISELVEPIIEIERLADPTNEALFQEIRQATMDATHVAPHYHVLSRHIKSGPAVISFVGNWIRRHLIETLYRRLATMFPETENWLTSADDIIHVGINAEI